MRDISIFFNFCFLSLLEVYFSILQDLVDWQGTTMQTMCQTSSMIICYMV